MMPFIRYESIYLTHFSSICVYLDSQDSVVGMATGLWAVRSRVRIPVWAKISFSSPQSTHRTLVPPDLLLFLNSNRRSFPWLNWLGREVNHLPPPSAKLKNVWSYTSITPYAFTAWTKKITLLFCTHLFIHFLASFVQVLIFVSTSAHRTTPRQSGTQAT
jgi:hypothetical protein